MSPIHCCVPYIYIYTVAVYVPIYSVQYKMLDRYGGHDSFIISSSSTCNSSKYQQQHKLMAAGVTRAAATELSVLISIELLYAVHQAAAARQTQRKRVSSLPPSLGTAEGRWRRQRRDRRQTDRDILVMLAK